VLKDRIVDHQLPGLRRPAQRSAGRGVRNDVHLLRTPTAARTYRRETWRCEVRIAERAWKRSLL